MAVAFTYRPLGWLGDLAPDSPTYFFRDHVLVYDDQGAGEKEAQYAVTGTKVIAKVSSDTKGRLRYYYNEDGDSLNVKAMLPSTREEKALIDAAWAVAFAAGQVR